MTNVRRRMVPSGWAFADGEDARLRFVHLYRLAATDLRSWFAVDMLLRRFPDAPVADWIAQAMIEQAAREAQEEVEAARLRASIVRVSPLLVRACGYAELPLAAVLHAVRPRMHVLFGAEGHPWLAAGSAEFDEAVANAGRRDGRSVRNAVRVDGAMIRPASHPLGEWTVRVVGLLLQTSLAIGPARINVAEDFATLLVDLDLPAAARAGLLGRPVRDLIGHPALDDDDFVIVSAEASGRGGTRIRFRCPPVLLLPEDRRLGPGCEHLLFGRYGRLRGEEALKDVALRLIQLSSRFGRPACVAAMRRRVAAIDQLAPPWAERLLPEGTPACTESGS